MSVLQTRGGIPRVFRATVESETTPGDADWGAPTGNSVTITGAASLPLLASGQSFLVRDHAAANNNGLYIATGTPTTSSLPCTKLTGDAPTDEAASATAIFALGRARSFGFTSLYLILRVLTNPCKLYFSQADYIDDVNFLTLPVAAADAPHGEWRGPIEAKEVWLLGDGGDTDIELVAFQRRG